jgi:hypothetical protein
MLASLARHSRAMIRNRDDSRHDLSADPFRERARAAASIRIQLLGAQFQFESDSPELLDLVKAAYAGLPAHRFTATVPRLRVRLELAAAKPARARAEPPPLHLLSGAGLLCGATNSSCFVTLSPQERTALIVVSREVFASSYHARYELIEFAVFTLAARVQGLAPLHAACVGLKGRGLLLMGSSGAGKSTVSLHCWLNDFDFLAEDSVFVAPESMLATGVANFLHIRADALRFLTRAADIAMLRNSPVIRRRSGVEKFEIDLRTSGHRIARAPLKVGALIFLSSQNAAGGALLTPMSRSRALASLRDSQPYAANQSGWADFKRGVGKLEAFELRRGRHPLEAVEALRGLLGSARPR